MKNHMTVLCGDEKDSALPTHTPTRASNALSLRKTVIGGMLVALTVALVRLFRTDRRLPLLSNPAFHQRYRRSFSWAVIWRRHGFLHLSDPESHGYRQSSGLPRQHAGAFLGAFLFRKTGRFVLAYAGEIIGTGIIGAMLCYPVAVLLIG